jgi:hypothetical protein
MYVFSLKKGHDAADFPFDNSSFFNQSASKRMEAKRSFKKGSDHTATTRLEVLLPSINNN